MRIETILESWDLTSALVVLAALGFFLAIYVNQLTHYEAEDIQDPWWIRAVMRPLAYLLLAWSFLWVFSYGLARGWQPWPPVILMIVAIDMILLIRFLAIKARVRRTGVRSDSPNAATMTRQIRRS
jgi:hypothetical protein